MEARLHTFGIKVADFERSLEFYRDRLGLTLLASTEDKKGRRQATFDTGGACFYIQWSKPDEGEPAGPRKPTARFDLAVDDIEAAWRAVSPNVSNPKGPPHMRHTGDLGFSVKDPDGTTIHFVQVTKK